MSSTAPRSLIDLLEASVARRSASPLFLCKTDGRWMETSYGAFSQLVDDTRRGLAALGVGPGDRVGIIAGNCLAWAAVAYASYGLRAAVVPLYESQRDTDWAFVLRDAGVGVVFAGNAAIRDRVVAFATTISTLREIRLLGDVPRAMTGTGQPGDEIWQRPHEDDVAAILYTSGTTGEPKGVVLTHGNIVSNITTVLDLIPMSERHRTLSFLPWAHAFGHTLELHGVIAAGASTAIAEGVDKIVDNLAEVRPTVLVAVPRVFLRVHAGVTALLASKPRPVRWLAERGLALARLRTAGKHLSWLESLLWKTADLVVFAKVRRRVGGRLEFAISGAAGLPRVVGELVDGLGIQVYEGYGLTEASPIVAANVPGHRKLGSVGRPIPGVRVEIDGGAADDPHPRQGEIVVRGPNVMRGYHTATGARGTGLTESGALRTGDLGYLDEDGYLYITGRLKEQYKLANGRYVSPAVLEERLKLSPHIADVLVYGADREHNVALVVPDLAAARSLVPSAAASDVDTLVHAPALRERIAADIEALSGEFRRFERIAAFALLPEPFTQANGMLTPSLKLRRREIVARWGLEIERLYAATDGPEHRAPVRERAG